MSWPVQLTACFLASICFSVLLNQPRRTILVSALIATAGYALFLFLGEGTMAYFGATLLMGISCEISARIFKRAATLFITSSLIPLVPGIGLYRTMRYAIEGDYAQAVTVGMSTLLGVFAIALALTFSSILFSGFHRLHPDRRRTL